MALYIPHSIFHLARLLYVRPETSGPYYVLCSLSAGSYFTCPKSKHNCGDSVRVTSKPSNSYLQVLADLLLGVVGFGFELR